MFIIETKNSMQTVQNMIDSRTANAQITMKDIIDNIQQLKKNQELLLKGTTEEKNEALKIQHLSNIANQVNLMRKHKELIPYISRLEELITELDNFNELVVTEDDLQKLDNLFKEEE